MGQNVLEGGEGWVQLGEDGCIGHFNLPMDSLAELLAALRWAGSARLYREPVSKTNRPIILNAVEYVVLPGTVNKETRTRVMEEIER